MNMKMKALVVATAMAMGAQAQAAINNDNSFNATTGNGSGELFLSVIDRGGSAPKSYTLDLGISASQFMADSASPGGFSLTKVADSNLTTFLSSLTGTVGWNVTAANNIADIETDKWGYLSTAPVQLIAQTNTPTGLSGLSTGLSNIAGYTTSVNQTLGTAQNDFAANVSTVVTDPASQAFHDRGGWGNQWNNSHPTEATLNGSMGFYLVALDLTTDPAGDTARVETFSGKWKLDGFGTLTYATAVVPAIPVPAAVWLLGSALVGLVGVARRKSEQA